MKNKELLKIIAQSEIKDQQELLERIQSEGETMTQSTLSRRLKALGVIKRNGVYTAPTRAQSQVSGLLTNAFVVEPNLIIVQTFPGHAQALAYYLDELHLRLDLKKPEEIELSDLIAGTIAGDDTIFVACDPKEVARAAELIKEILS